MIITFVISTLVANIIIALVGVGMAHYSMEIMVRRYGDDFIPDMQAAALRMLLLVVVILIIFGVALYSKIYTYIITPLRGLSDATKKIAEGELDFTIDPPSRDDEIGDLCRSFENMRQRLKASAEEKIENEEMNRQLISNITHDLKTPVTAIKGYAEGMLDGLAATPEKQEKYLKTIYNKSEDLNRLINELTYYTHIDQSHIPYNFEKINLESYFKDCVEDLILELNDKNIQVNYTNELPLDSLIIADRVQLKKVINNIIGNSIKYSDKDKPWISITLKDMDSLILIEFSDNGRGISQKDLPHIFDRFFRSDTARSSSTGGSGIGLSIVQKIVLDHGGRIWATSIPGEGTTMHVEMRKYMEA